MKTSLGTRISLTYPKFLSGQISGADIDIYIIYRNHLVWTNIKTLSDVGLHRDACPRTTARVTALDGERGDIAAKEDGGR